jgi:FkbM family methyltransferase
MSEWWKNEHYSQFGEDALLFSFFRNKGYGRSKKLDDIGDGFYVDIGCHHPYMISNTWFFYQRGWRGINVDPTPGVKKEFDEIRPEDINLQIAIASEDGEATLYHYGRAVYNTLDEARAQLDPSAEKITVQTLRLDTLLDKYLPPVKELSILSVDVEGLDLEVLRSNNWNKYRPEVVVAELHQSSMQKIISSDLFLAMSGWGYELYGWAQPSLVFRRR